MTAGDAAADDDGVDSLDDGVDSLDDAVRDNVSEDEANVRSFALMRLAEVLRDDISPVACLSCADEGRERNRAACPCFATLHPFCDLFHTWLCHRLIDDGSGTCCLLPAQVITDPELDAENELASAEADSALLKPTQEAIAAAVAVVNSGESPAKPGMPAWTEKGETDAACEKAGVGNAEDPDVDCDATRFHTDSEGGSVAGCDGPPEVNPSEDEEAPTDPLTSQLRELAPTASAMVYSLEKNVGDLSAQKSELHDQLAMCVELSTTGVSLALEEVLEWYSVLSILACSFPTQRELLVQKKKAQRRAAAEEAATGVAEAEEAAADEAEAEAASAIANAASAGAMARAPTSSSASDLEFAAAKELLVTSPVARKASSELAPLVQAERDGLVAREREAKLLQTGSKAPSAADPSAFYSPEEYEREGSHEESDDEMYYANHPDAAVDAKAEEAEEEAEAVAEAAAEAAAESSQIVNSSLDLPPLLLRDTDIGQPLRPIFLGAASEKDAGQWFMGLQGLRESPAQSIEDLCQRRWGTWQQSHCKYLHKVSTRQCMPSAHAPRMSEASRLPVTTDCTLTSAPPGIHLALHSR